MKTKASVIGIIIVLMILINNCTQQDQFPVLEGSFLGQQLPGMEPEIFATGILNTDTTGAFCSVFSPAGDEFYFTRYWKIEGTPGGLAWMRLIDGVWTEPEMLHFNSEETENDVCMSNDGNQLVFRSWRALPDGRKPDNHSYLWYARRTPDGWSDASPLYFDGEPVRTGYPSMAEDSSLYFAHRQDGICGIYRAEPVEDGYSTPEHVFTAVDSIDTEGDMYVAPDESYMILSLWNHPENIGGGQGDLYITFQRDDGTWTEEIHMGESINTRFGENCPQVSPDGKYFFFNRYDPESEVGNIYWLSSEIIENLKPDERR